ncbi:tetratricopeptide repeat protein [Zobellella iuensis]|uniref:O-GlcNAc transferase C-terminal domain-containing protein n=1 Tax=Zobellella iuensis TaxID=2803811 RepID=A0ABS1QVZ4_9GAMM|nr:hypothetical protein [Zobellella iuensis]MBL1378404.1 hypothetical protein [Zobellella iuensis]
MQQNNDSDTMKVQQLLDKGLHCYHNRKLDKALYYFEQLLHVDSENTELLHSIVKLLQEMEDFDKASLYGEQLIALSPDNEDFLLAQAENFFHINCYSEALKLYLRLHELHPSSMHLLERLVTIYKQEYDFSDSDVGTSVKDNEESQIFTIDITLSLSFFLINKNQLNEAKILLESVLLIESDNIEAYGLYGVLLEKKEKYEKAIFYLDKAVSSSSFKYLTPLTKCLEASFSTSAVVYYLEKLVKKFPDDDLNKKLLGLYYYRNGNYVSADQTLSSFSDDNEDLVLFKYRVLSRYLAIDEGKKFIEKNDLISVSNELFKLRKALPHDREVISNLMKFYLNMGEVEKAYDICLELDKIIPNNKTNVWNKHMYFLAKRDRGSFFQSYISGRYLRYNASWETVKDKVWNGEDIKGKRVVILREQGIGDEILFASNYEWIVEKASHVDIYCSPRLINLFSSLFPSAHFHPVLKGEFFDIKNPDVQALISSAEKVILSGDLPYFSYKEMGRLLYKENYFKVAGEVNSYWKEKLSELVDAGKIKVGLIWRSSFVSGARSTSYLTNNEVAYIISSVPEVEFINCMYVECENDLGEIEQRSGRVIHRLNELDQKNDFENTAAMLSNLDLLFGAYTATLSLSTAVGTPAVAYAADYLKKDKKLKKEAFYYSPKVSHISLPLNNSEKRKEAINLIIDEIRKVLNLDSDLISNV